MFVCEIVYLLLLRLPPLSVASRQTGRRSGRRVFHCVSPAGSLPLCLVSRPSGFSGCGYSCETRPTLGAFFCFDRGAAAGLFDNAVTCCDLAPGGDAHCETSGASVRLILLTIQYDEIGCDVMWI